MSLRSVACFHAAQHGSSKQQTMFSADSSIATCELEMVQLNSELNPFHRSRTHWFSLVRLPPLSKINERARLQTSATLFPLSLSLNSLVIMMADELLWRLVVGAASKYTNHFIWYAFPLLQMHQRTSKCISRLAQRIQLKSDCL